MSSALIDNQSQRLLTVGMVTTSPVTSTIINTIATIHLFLQCNACDCSHVPFSSFHPFVEMLLPVHVTQVEGEHAGNDTNGIRIKEACQEGCIVQCDSHS